MKDLFAVVREYSNQIKNGRKPHDIFNYLLDEVRELEEEMFGVGDGKDGIAGEAVDVILCALDLIFKVEPNWTDQDIVKYAETKCEKWARKYS